MTNEVTTYNTRAPLTPVNMTQAMQLAEMMAKSALVPKDLQGKPADCLLVIEQAMRWEMSPFAVAQSASVIHGKLMYEGKLVAAVVNTRPEMEKRLSYSYSGEGDERTVVVKGKLKNEDENDVSVRLKDVKTENKAWRSQPDQQLAYSGARIWARRHMPEAMLGVYVPEEDMEDRPASVAMPANGVTINQAPVNTSPVVTPPMHPDTGEFSPHTIPVPLLPENKGSDWMKWGSQLATALNACKAQEELDEWILKNADAMDNARKEAAKIHARLSKVYEANLQRITTHE